MKKIYPLLFVLLISCQQEVKKVAAQSITGEERALLDSLQMDSSLVLALRKYTQSPIRPFERPESEGPVMDLKGVVFKETELKGTIILDKLQAEMKEKGYTLFALERNYGIELAPDIFALLNTVDPYKVLAFVGTDGINYDIENDSLLKIIHQLDDRYSLRLRGAGDDWCEFKIGKDPEDWKVMGNEIYRICPDIVDQGTGTVDTLAMELKNTKTLFLWWD